MNRKQIALLSCFTNQDHFMEHKCRKKAVLCSQSVTIRQCPFCLQTSRVTVILTEGNSENAGTLSKLGLLWSGKKAGKNNFSMSVESQGILFSFLKTSCKRINFDSIQVTRGVLVSWFPSI